MRKLIISTGILFTCLTACQNPQQQSTETNNTETTASIPAPSLITYQILGTIPHDTQSFTEGFLIHGKDLYEGTGLEKMTKLIKTDTASGKSQVLNDAFDDKIFGEGITVLKDKLYQLTYKNNLIYVYDLANLKKPIATHNWPKEGWGATNDGTSLIFGDGSSKIYFVDPQSMQVSKELIVKDNTGEVDRINELEYIDGFIFANRWGTEFIYKIDPNSGNIVGKISFEGIIQQYDKNFIADEDNVLNGIAYDLGQQVLFITGKNWPLTFKIKLNQ